MSETIKRDFIVEMRSIIGKYDSIYAEYEKLEDELQLLDSKRKKLLEEVESMRLVEDNLKARMVADGVPMQCIGSLALAIANKIKNKQNKL
jgi:hypothetical protein